MKTRGIYVLLAILVSVCFANSADAGAFNVHVDTVSLAGKGQVIIEADLAGVFPLSQDSLLDVSLRPLGGKSALLSKSVWPGLVKTRIGLSMKGLPTGEYEVVVALKDKEGGRHGRAVNRFKWDGNPSGGTSDADGMRVLNSVVIELMSKRSVQLRRHQELTFTTPHDGWVFLTSTVSVKGREAVHISLSGEKSLYVHNSGTSRTFEAMRYLRKGQHTVKISCEGKPFLEALFVRSIPELIYSDFPENPHVAEFGMYDWYYLDKHILGNVNAMISFPFLGSDLIASGDKSKMNSPYMREWVQQGKKWIFHSGLPGTGINTSAAIDDAYNYWSTHPGFVNPLVSGIIVDEFSGASEDPKYNVWTHAVDKLYQDPATKGKTFYAYTYGEPMCEKKPSAEFAETLFKHGGIIALEWYPTERPDFEGLNKDMVWWRNHLDVWRANRQDALRHLLVNMGYMSAPPESLNVNPSVDFKVHMDMYMNWIANDPTFIGLYGIAWYKNSYADEECVRWASRLFRHYFIEGKTNLLSNELGFKYNLTHIQNPDFEKGLEGWSVFPADEGSITTEKTEDFGYLQGRYIGYVAGLAGNSVLRTVRSALKPNIISQEVKGLVPGRLYSVKLITADYQGFISGKTADEKHAVSIKVENGQLVESKSFQQILSNHPVRCHGKFEAGNRLWMNYHYKLFKAVGKTARLVISDWADDTSPGGPVGQQLMYNFVEVQPYYNG